MFVGPCPSNSSIASVASVSRLSEFAIFRCSSRSMRFIKSLSGSSTRSSLSVSLSGTKSGRQDRVSDRIILSPGRWISLMSYSDSKSDHRACLRFSFCALRKYVRFL